MGTFVSCKRPRPTSKEEHLKRTPEPWTLKEKHNCKPSNYSLIESHMNKIRLWMKPWKPWVPSKYNRTNENPYSRPTTVWLPTFPRSPGPRRRERLFHNQWQSCAAGVVERALCWRQPTWAGGLASLQRNCLTLGKSLLVSVPVSSSIKCREKEDIWHILSLQGIKTKPASKSEVLPGNY